MGQSGRHGNSLVPLPEWSGVDLDNTVLDQCLGSHQLVVGGVVDHVQDTCLASQLPWSSCSEQYFLLPPRTHTT